MTRHREMTFKFEDFTAMSEEIANEKDANKHLRIANHWLKTIDQKKFHNHGPTPIFELLDHLLQNKPNNGYQDQVNKYNNALKTLLKASIQSQNPETLLNELSNFIESQKDHHKLIYLIYKPELLYHAVLLCLQNKNNPSVNIDQLNNLLNKLPKEVYSQTDKIKDDIVRAWLQHPNTPSITFAQFQTLLKKLKPFQKPVYMESSAYSYFNKDSDLYVWLEQPNTQTSQLEDFLRNVKNREYASIAIKRWLDKQSAAISFENLQERFLSKVKTDSIKRIILSTWLKHPNTASISRDDLNTKVKTLDFNEEMYNLYLDDPYNSLVISWFQNPNNKAISLDVLQLDSLPNDAIIALLKNPNTPAIPIETLKSLLPKINTELESYLFNSNKHSYKTNDEITNLWMKHPNTSKTSFKDLEFLLGRIFTSSNIKREVIQSWLQNNHPNISLNDLKTIILDKIDEKKHSHNPLKLYLIESWLSMPNSPSCDVDEIKSLIKAEGKKTNRPQAFVNLIKSWLENPNTKPINTKDLKSLFKVQDYTYQYDFDPIKLWLEKENTPPISIKDFQLIIRISIASKNNSSIKFNSYNHFEDLLKILLKKPNTPAINLEELEEFLKIPHLKIPNNINLVRVEENKHERRKAEIVKLWLKMPEIAYFEADKLSQLVSKFDSVDKFEIIELILNHPNLAVRNSTLGELLTGFKINVIEDIKDLVSLWLNSENTTAINAKELQELLSKILPLDNPNFYNTTLQFRNDITHLWIEKYHSTISKDNLKTLLPNFEDDYLKHEFLKSFLNNNPPKDLNDLVSLIKDLNLTYDTFQILLLSYNSIIKPNQLPEFAQLLYPNSEAMRIDLFELAIFNNILNPNNNEILAEFLATIENTNEVTYLIEKYERKNIGQVSEFDILSLLKGRLAVQYKSINGALKTSIYKGITNEGTGMLGDIFPNQNLSKVTLSDLLSYYTIKGSTKGFYAILEPAIKDKIKEEFNLSKDIKFLKPAEYECIQTLTDNSVKFIKAETLCDYFVKKLPIPITKIEGYKINFEGSIIDAKKHQSLNEQFQTLLKTEKPIQEDVINFFKEILDIDNFDEIVSIQNKKKLTEFFNKNKSALATLFTKKDAVKDFSAAIATLSHGCSANIGNQFHIALYSNLLKDHSIEDQVFFSIFNSQIIYPILNRGGSDVIDITDNFLENKNVKDHMISPTGILDLLMNKIESSQRVFILAELFKSNEDLAMLTDEVQMKKIIAHSILQKIPEILNHPDLSEFKKEYAVILESLKDKEEEKEVIPKTTEVNTGKHKKQEKTSPFKLTDTLPADIVEEKSNDADISEIHDKIKSDLTRILTDTKVAKHSVSNSENDKNLLITIKNIKHGNLYNTFNKPRKEIASTIESLLGKDNCQTIEQNNKNKIIPDPNSFAGKVVVKYEVNTRNKDLVISIPNNIGLLEKFADTVLPLIEESSKKPKTKVKQPKHNQVSQSSNEKDNEGR